MKSKFHGYYRPSDDEFKALWNDSIIVLDANVLLNLYTYSKDTWEEILGLLEAFKERIWLPYQAAEEYHRNRCGIIDKEATRYSGVKKELKIVCEQLGARKSHPFIEQKLFEQFEALTEQIDGMLSAGEDAHKSLIQNDLIRDRVTELFDRRVGDPFAQKELEAIYTEGAIRYAKKVPPGFADEKKPEPDRYGDLVLWKQLIEHALREKKSILFVTDDAKSDWWLISNNSKIGPRPELLHEFREKAKQEFYIYGTEMFVEIAKPLGKEISKKAVEEVRTAAERRERAKRVRQVRDVADVRKLQFEAELVKQAERERTNDSMQAYLDGLAAREPQEQSAKNAFWDSLLDPKRPGPDRKDSFLKFLEEYRPSSDQPSRAFIEALFRESSRAEDKSENEADRENEGPSEKP